MDLSLNWLSDYVDLSGLTPETIAHELTMKTALIEGFVDHRAALTGVMVGEVLSCGPHPGADRLRVCEVSVGDGAEPAHVVCGAPNVEPGQKVVYAPVGVRLPNGVKLKKAKIRGEPSYGMICAEDELGLGPEHDGILVLDQELAAGTPIADIPGMADVVFDIDNKSVTHRPDLWGHFGFARELAVIFGRELKPLALHTGLTAGDAGPQINLDEDCGCTLYAGLCADGVSARTPDWMRFRLVACGMRPINLAVDLSNYVMLELGQPTHPFDRDQLAGDCIRVRRGEPGESLTTLDEVKRELGPDDTVIADGQQGVAIAGIMGSADAEVGEGTKRLFLESASFDSVRVRKTSSRLGLRSEALSRFEKVLDPGLVECAVARYAELLRQLDPDAVLSTTYRVAGEAVAPEIEIELDPGMVQRTLGTDVELDTMRGALEGLGFEWREGDGQRLAVKVPPWRATRDVTSAEDLVEEVGRVVGYDSIPIRHPIGPLLIGDRDPVVKVEEALRDVLAQRASCTEVFSYSTLRDRTVEILALELPEGQPRLTNALQQDASRLRPSVMPELLMQMESWLRSAPEARLFEVGRGYSPDAETGLREHREVAVLLVKRGSTDDREMVRDVRGIVDAAVRGAGRDEATLSASKPDANEPWWHPHRHAQAELDGRIVARFGALNPATLARIGLDVTAAGVLLDPAALAGCPRAASHYQAPSRLPPALCDLAFVAKYELSTDVLLEAIRKSGPKTLASVEPFDVFRGGALGKDERSVAFHLTFRAKDRTLSEDDLSRARERIVKGVEQLGARLR